MAVNALRDFLDDHDVRYLSIDHSPAYTAREVASSAFVPRREFAKSVIVDADGKEVMVVVPASRHVDLDAVASAIGADTARLATEQEFKSRFPDCEVGAMPPFGNLYAMPVYMDEMVREVDDICFNAGSHVQVLRMECEDYVALAKPVIGHFSVKE